MLSKIVSINPVNQNVNNYLSNIRDLHVQTRSCILSSYGKSPLIHWLSAELPVPHLNKIMDVKPVWAKIKLG